MARTVKENSKRVIVYNFIKENTKKGKPISDSEIQAGLGLTRATVCNYRTMLLKSGAIKFAGANPFGGPKKWVTADAKIEHQTKKQNEGSDNFEQSIGNINKLLRELNESLEAVVKTLSSIESFKPKRVSTTIDWDLKTLSL